MKDETLEALEKDVDKLIALCRNNKELYMQIRPVVMHMYLTIQYTKNHSKQED